jgi:hypothetical protein
MNVHRRGLSFVALVATVVIGCAACSSGSGSSSSGAVTTTGDVPGSAKITTFDAPRTVTCDAAPSTTIQVKYATKEAERQEVIVDGRAVPGTEAATGQVEAPVHCDPLEHTVVLVAYDKDGRRTAQTKYLHTEMPGASS